MTYGALPSARYPVSRLVLGTSALVSAPEATDALDVGVDLGYNAIDTAPIYGNGAVEVWLGRWIKARRLRDRVFIITKGGHPVVAGPPRLSRDALWHDLHRSLQSLQTDSIDLFLLHRDDPTIEIEPIAVTLHAMWRQGKINAYGVSNWPFARIEQLKRFCLDNGLPVPCISSVQFSLAECVKDPWPGTYTLTGQHKSTERAWYVESRLPLLAWSSLSAGSLNEIEHGARMREAAVLGYLSARNSIKSMRATSLAKALSVTQSQIALAYVLNQPMDVFAAVSCRRPDHLRQNAAATSIVLSEASCAWLNLDEHGAA